MWKRQGEGFCLGTCRRKAAWLTPRLGSRRASEGGGGCAPAVSCLPCGRRLSQQPWEPVRRMPASVLSRRSQILHGTRRRHPRVRPRSSHRLQSCDALRCRGHVCRRLPVAPASFRGGAPRAFKTKRKDRCLASDRGERNDGAPSRVVALMIGVLARILRTSLRIRGCRNQRLGRSRGRRGSRSVSPPRARLPRRPRAACGGSP